MQNQGSSITRDNFDARNAGGSESLSGINGKKCVSSCLAGPVPEKLIQAVILVKLLAAS